MFPVIKDNCAQENYFTFTHQYNQVNAFYQTRCSTRWLDLISIEPLLDTVDVAPSIETLFQLYNT